MAATLAASSTASKATTINLSLNGDTGAFAEFQYDVFGLHFQDFFLPLTGLDAGNAVTVSQGDTVHSTITLNGEYTIPASIVWTGILTHLMGTSFPLESTRLLGTYTFYDHGTLGTSLVSDASSFGKLGSGLIIATR